MMKRVLSQYALWRLKSHLKRGGIVAYPTESCFGLGGLPRSQRAIQSILKIKKRPQNKGLIVIGKDLNQLKPFLQKLPQSTEDYLNDVWAAPKTFILPAHRHLPIALRGRQRQQLAVRVPDHMIARQICQMAHSALISTSCNRSGRKACRTQREAKRQFGRNVWVLGGQIGRRKKPSEIIDFYQQKQIR